MKVKLAEKAGFCMGVKRAMDIVLKLSEETKSVLYTYGPLIHNPQVIDVLKKKGIFVAKDSEPIKRGMPLVIRTHGITPQKKKALQENGIVIKDATCPLVMKVQNSIKKYIKKGYSIVIVGDKGHAEVNGLIGFAEGKGTIINSIDDVDMLPHEEKICVVAQTTISTSLFSEISLKIKEKYPNPLILNTICDATEKRQKEALEMCNEVDAMIVVGGKNSANTNRLANICQLSGVPTFFIETEKELNLREMNKFNTLGITAGASTPNWMINRVVAKVEGIKKQNKNIFIRELINIYEFLIKSNIYTAIGGASIAYTTCLLLGIEPRGVYLSISFLYLFSMYLLNSFTEEDVTKVTTPDKMQFLKQHKSHFATWGAVSLLLSLFLSGGLGTTAFIVILLSSFVGVLYSVKVVPSAIPSVVKYTKYNRLKDIPGSKDISVALAWSVITVLIPFCSADINKTDHWLNIVSAFLFVFGIVYIRTVLFDIKDIQGDNIVGRETMPIIIGKENTKVFLVSVASLLAMLLLGAAYAGWFSSLGYLLLLSIVYIYLYLYMYHKRIISHGLTFESVVDGKFILTGILSFFWRHQSAL